MGVNQSADLLVGNEFEQTSFNVKNDTHFIKDISNDLYGDAQLIQYKESISHPYLILKSRLIASKQEYEEFIKEPQKRKQHRSPYLIPLLNIYQVKQQDYCSKYYKVYMLYQYFEKNLFDYMIDLNEQQQSFTQADILQMVENVLQGLIYLKDQGIQHDMIKSSTIAVNTNNQIQNYSMIDEHQNITCNKFNNAIQGNNTYQNITNQQIKYIISDSKFMNNGKDSYAQALLGDAQDFYLSPQLFNRLKHRYITAFSGDNQNTNEQHSIETSNVFSLGMVSIEMATLKSVRKIYDLDQFCLNKGRLMNRLDLISQMYSPQLAFIISKMLLFNEKDRPTYQEMLNILHYFQQDPSQFLDINFTPEIILENYNLSNTEVNIQNCLSQINGSDEDNVDIIKRAEKQNLQETNDLYSFKVQTNQQDTQTQVVDSEKNINFINNSPSKNDPNKCRSKSPNTQRKEFSTPNKVHNEHSTPGKSSSHHMRGLSTAIHNPGSQSSNKNNLSYSENFKRNNQDQQNSQLNISQNNQIQQPILNFQQNQSESQIRFHRDEVNNTPYSTTYLPNSIKSGGKLSSQILPSYKPSNQSSRVPSQKLIHYTQPDFKLEKEYECVPNQSLYNQINNNNLFNKMKPTDPVDRKKYSNSYSQSLLQSSMNNTIKQQGSPFIHQSQKQENFNQIDQYELKQSYSNSVSQQSHHAHSKTLSEIMQESNKVILSKQLPSNQALNKYSQDSINQKKRSITPNIINSQINFDELNKSIKINQNNPPNSVISPHNNFQKSQQNHFQQPLLSNKSGRSESLIASHQNLYSPIGDSKNTNKISLKFSPKNASQNNNLFQGSSNFIQSSDEVKKSCPTQKSMVASIPQQGINQSGQVNPSMKLSIQNSKSRQQNTYSSYDNDNNHLLNQQCNNYNVSQNNSIQRNDDSISVQVPNEVDMNNHEYPPQRIYKSETKLKLESKNQLPISPDSSSYHQNQQSYQQTEHNNISNNFLNSCQQKNLNSIQSSYNKLNQPQESQNLGDSQYPSYTQSIGFSNNRPSQQQLQNVNLYPSQSYKQLSQNINQNNPCYIPSASSLAIAHNFINGSNKFEQSVSVKEQLFMQPPHQNIYDLIQQKQQNNNLSYSKSQLDIKSIVKDKSSENILDNSLINQNLTINGPPTPRNQIRGNRNMYHLYEKSPNKNELQYKLEKVTIPEEEYQKDIAQTITELEQKIRDFDRRITKSKQDKSQIISQQDDDKSPEEKESSFKKFLNTFSCKSNTNIKTEGDNCPIPQQRTPLKNLFTDDRISPERFPIGEDVNLNTNNTGYSRYQLSNNNRQNYQNNSSRNQNLRMHSHSSKSPVQNPRDMKTFFQETTPFAENQQ